MDGLFFFLLCAILWQLVMLRRDVQSIDAPIPSLGLGGGLLSDLGGVPVPSDGVCGRWDGPDPEPCRDDRRDCERGVE